MLRTPKATALLVLLAVLTTAGCEVPKFHGPQIQSPPPGFTLNPDTYLDRRIFPELEVVYHDAWVEASWGDFSGIYINGHDGRLTRAHVEAARADAIEARGAGQIEFGEIEEITVDGRTAWGWTEWWRQENVGLRYVAYRAMVPYDTVSFAVEFLTGDPSLKSRPDSLRTIVASFAVGETKFNIPLLLIMAGVLLLVGNTMRSRRQAKAERLRNIRLVQVPKKDRDKEKQDRTHAPAGPSPPAPPSGAPAAATPEAEPPPDPSASITDAVQRRVGDNEPPTH